MDTIAFDHQGIKSGTVFLCFDNFYSFILANNIVIYLSFAIIYGNLLKYITVTMYIPPFAIKSAQPTDLFMRICEIMDHYARA